VTGRVLELSDILAGSEDQIARNIAYRYVEWDNYRRPWLNEKSEIRDYIFATDTRKTANARLPWKNSTTLPKLTQIRDNLHANYMAALFPNADWLEWEGTALDDQTEQKAAAIEAYMQTKLRQDKAQVTVSQLLLDYIDYGNCFATVKWVDESIKDKKTGKVIRGYVGPRIVRISPYDIVFNPTAPSFESSPKIIRTISTLGELAKDAEKWGKDSDEYKLFQAAMERSINVRKQVRAMAQGDQLKSEGFMIDGFGSIQVYFQNDYCEVLTFYGDIYDMGAEKFEENQIIQIIDRSFVIFKKQNPNWTNHGGFFHAGWRQRPDNLYAMGPLDNLVGMQYRIDHLENLKADVFDFIAWPMQKVKGYVQDYNWEPGGRIYVGDDGDVEILKVDSVALNADMQIEALERKMEELAGAPKEAMGIRSPGEKTKFEVQVLDNAASRIFLNKIKHFETTFFEPLLNYGLMVSRQNMTGNDVVRTLDSQVDAVIFSTVTKDDITANGILRPMGASHFADRANKLQNLFGMMNSPTMQDPAVKVHMSGKKIARLAEELADLEEYSIFGDNVRVFEALETQKLTAQGQEQAQAASNTPPGTQPHDQPGAAAPSAQPTNAGQVDIAPRYELDKDRAGALANLKGDQAQ
jgi:hypothetical protein